MIKCSRENVVLSEYKNLDQAKWGYQDSLYFDWDVSDTNTIYNVDLLLRTSTSYKWANIYVFSDIYFPNGKARRDTFEFLLANNNGHWIGERSGIIVKYNFPLFKKIKLPIAGKYQFSIQQAMRDTILSEISNVGIKITLPE